MISIMTAIKWKAMNKTIPIKDVNDWPFGILISFSVTKPNRDQYKVT
jgi:hypothetical protein